MVVVVVGEGGVLWRDAWVAGVGGRVLESNKEPSRPLVSLNSLMTD